MTAHGPDGEYVSISSTSLPSLPPHMAWLSLPHSLYLTPFLSPSLSLCSTFLKAVSAGIGEDGAWLETAPQPPVFFNEGLAFMFETNHLLKVAPSALAADRGLQLSYARDCWGPQRLPKLFTGQLRPPLPQKKKAEA